MAVVCRTCLVAVWQGNEPVEPDGQVLLTAYADSAPGRECPSKVTDCPHKTAAVEAAKKRRPATLGDLETLRAQLTALEAKVRP